MKTKQKKQDPDSRKGMDYLGDIRKDFRAKESPKIRDHAEARKHVDWESQ